jgi:hypothetical protein
MYTLPSSRRKKSKESQRRRHESLDQNLQLLAVLLGGQLSVAVGAEPVCHLPPVPSVGQRPPKDVHELLLALGPALDLGLGPLAAVRAVDELRLAEEAGEGHHVGVRGRVVAVGVGRDAGVARARNGGA